MAVANGCNKKGKEQGEPRAVIIYAETLERLEDLEDTVVALPADTSDTISLRPSADRELANA